MALIIKIFFLSLLFYVGDTLNTDNLIALVQVFRHGARVPMSFYQNDPFKYHWGDLDVGQLTNEGRLQLYALGQLTRSRYSDWIPTKYNKNFFYAQTTDVDRTHMSAQSYLYGLFPATDDQIWLPNLTWQPIPVHPADPRVLWNFSYKCPAFDILQRNLLDSEEFVKINENYENVYDFLTAFSGDNITDIESAQRIHDTLNIENSVGLTIPAWTEMVFPEPLKSISGIGFKSITYTTPLKRFFTGALLNEIVEYFQNMTIDATSSHKMQVYSAHDSNIAGILNTIGNYDPPTPPHFAATIWLELRNSSDTTYVNVWSKDGDTITQLSINGCELDCPLDEVKIKLSDILVDVETWVSECNSSV